ncbi:MAG: Uma2 family endonuclease [Gallionella sp.]|nr:Uma2 family endonuclease [Gallionella sp.]
MKKPWSVPVFVEPLRSQFVTLKTGRGQHRKYLPYVFTEHGAIMAATILNSPKAVEMSVFIVRAFVQLREMLSSNAELAAKLLELQNQWSLTPLILFYREYRRGWEMNGILNWGKRGFFPVHKSMESDPIDFGSVVRPDVLVICYQPEGERLTRAPSLIFEVVSPKSARRDEVIKFDLYRTEGVMHYVLIYTDSKKAKAYRLIEGEYRKVGDFHDEQHCFELPGCAIDFDFSRIWKRKGVAA